MRTRTKFKTPKPWLNGFKRRDKIYRLEVGYVIHNNGNYMWCESIKEYNSSIWSSNSVEFPATIRNKLNKNPEAYGNLKLIQERQGIQSWKVIVVDQEDPIWIKPKVLDDDTGEELQLFAIIVSPDKLRVEGSVVEKKTVKQYNLKEDLFYKRRWYLHELNKVMRQDPIFRPNPLFPRKCAVCTLDNLQDTIDACFAALEKSVESSLKQAQKNLEDLNLLKEENGY